MKLYNSLSKQTEDFVPLSNTQVKIYSCGPTVYDHVHIGNLSSFIYADTLRRLLSASGYEVVHVMNFTDVDDKTIARSKIENHNENPKTALRELTEKYSRVFLEDMRSIGNDIEAYQFVRATDYIEPMQELIRKLLQKGIAYIADDGVYFSIKAYRNNGKKYGQLLTINEENTSEERIQNDEYDKESIHDFALWKKQKEGEPYWEFEIEGQQLDGRPGWHIECSAMSEAALGLPFDIHTGGIDLVFPHHENEIAQSTASGEGDVMAQVFFHNEHLLVDGRKMSKSLNNFYTLEDVRAKNIDPLAFRLLVLQSHYRSQSNFTWEVLEAAQNLLQRLRAVADLRFQTAGSEEWVGSTPIEVKQYLDDDLNTPMALASLSGFLDLAASKLVAQAELDIFVEKIGELDVLFGLQLLQRQDINQEQKQLLEKRAYARSSQDWQQSDALRDQLKDMGLLVRDTPMGQIWERL